MIYTLATIGADYPLFITCTYNSKCRRIGSSGVWRLMLRSLRRNILNLLRPYGLKTEQDLLIEEGLEVIGDRIRRRPGSEAQYDNFVEKWKKYRRGNND